MRRLEPLQRIFTLDLRSIALFRIGLALLSLYDLSLRWPSLAAFVSDHGFFTRTDFLTALNRPWSLSFHFIFGEPLQLHAVFAVHAACAVALLIGWRPRVFAVLLWILTGSLINRNPLAVNGGDTLFGLLFFWAMFLPLGARWSVEAVRRQKAGQRVLDNAWCDWGGVGLMTQIIVLYLSTVALKSDVVWYDGSALTEAFKVDLLMKPLAYQLQPHSEMLQVLTWATVLLEWTGPALILLPWGQRWLRPLTIAAFCGFHFGTFLCMELALFPWACIVAWIALLPGTFWDARAWRRFRLRTRGAPDATGAQLRFPQGPLSRLACVVTLVFILIWVSRPVLPDPLEERLTADLTASSRLFRLRQSWSMFAPRPPRQDEWFVLRARQANGAEIDLLAGGQPLTWEKPAYPSLAFPNRRWTKYLSNLGKSRYRELRGSFGDYYIRTWNESHDVGYQVLEVEFYALQERSDRPDGPPKKLRLWYRKNIPPTL